jgi:hypothetical protein
MPDRSRAPQLTTGASRRATLAAALGASAAAIARPIPATAAGARPDADLIAGCAEYERLYGAFVAAHDGPDAPEDDDELDAIVAPINDRLRWLTDRICEARPATLDGHRARARALACLDPEALGDFLCADTVDARLTTALLRDLLGGPLPPAMAGEPQRQKAAAAVCRPAQEWQMPIWPEHKVEKLRELNRQLLALAEEP